MIIGSVSLKEEKVQEKIQEEEMFNSSTLQRND